MTAYKSGDPTTLNRLYGRAKGKPLRAGQQELVDKLLPQIAVPEEGPVTAEQLFGRDCPLHFEIGFGGGEHMAYRADLLPDHGFIGAEPFLNGVAQALTHVDGDGGKHPPIRNVRIHHGDALEV
ncbi:MAG TPA: tRNA (guanosine(46)-N7)-methyltransferase TrmB, partial [Sphingomonadaceae bacterium]|nr:tRNA (guanosine(46)-N7)-methyltransferase TrmB [Sphingomonadaceae bacterium]